MTEGLEYFPGPIYGVRYKYGQHIESLQFIYDACYCDFSITSTNPVSVLMGSSSIVTLTQPVSTLGTDIFDERVESCAQATSIYLDTPSSIFSITDSF